MSKYTTASIYHRHENELYEQSITSLVIGFILIGLGMIYALCVFGNVFRSSSLLLYIPILLLVSPGSYFLNKAKILFFGFQGEEITQQILSELPQNHYIFNNVKIIHDCHQSQLDTVIVSKKGVFIVESKNHIGQIIGQSDSPTWLQRKISGKGNTYLKEMRNPIIQVKRQVFNLSQNFKQNNIHVWIQGVVVFSNNLAQLDISNSSGIPILESDSLKSYLDDYQPKSKINEDTINKIKEWLILHQ